MVAATTTQIIQLLANVVLAAFTIVLAVTTFLYYRQTKAQTNEMAKSRQAEFTPVLLGYVGSNAVRTFHFIAIENIGEGMAQNVRAEWHIEGLEETNRDYRKPTYQPSERRIFTFPVDVKEAQSNLEKLKEEIKGTDGILIMNIQCEDALGDSHEFHYEIDIVEQSEGRLDAGETWLSDRPITNLGRYDGPPSGEGHDM